MFVIFLGVLRAIEVSLKFLRFDQRFRPFFSHLATMKFYKVEFTSTSGAGMTARKISKYFDFSALQWHLNHSNLLSTLHAIYFRK